MMSKRLFLSSYEYKSFAAPRKIKQYSWTNLDGRDCLIAEVDIPVDGRKYGLSNECITTLYLLNRFAEDAIIFKNLSSFPIEVHVLIPTSEKEINSVSQLKHIVWATLYDNLKDAENHRIL